MELGGGRIIGRRWFEYSSGFVSEESVCNAGHLGLIPGLGRSLEKEMVTHPSILAKEIPWTEERDGLQSMTFEGFFLFLFYFEIGRAHV